jgi:hypothetical protein
LKKFNSIPKNHLRMKLAIGKKNHPSMTGMMKSMMKFIPKENTERTLYAYQIWMRSVKKSYHRNEKTDRILALE